MSQVWIRGEGVAAACCARLLDRAGTRTVVETIDRPKVPAVMLSDATQSLFRDVFERVDLFEDLPKIKNRVVAWGADAQPITLPHSAVVVSEQTLLERIEIKPPMTDRAAYHKSEAEWKIFTARPLPAPSVERQFGSRTASASAVTLNPRQDAETCWVESLENGWLFLLPGEREGAWLLSVGGPPDQLLAASRLVADQIVEVKAPQGQFPAHPRIADPLCGDGWLACGTAAMGFDPLCGEGTGNAIREAILGSAAIRAIADAGHENAVLAHYRMRLLGGFKRHLEICREFYRRGGCGDWWDREVAVLECGLEWCSQQLSGAPAPRYRLNGFALEAVAI